MKKFEVRCDKCHKVEQFDVPEEQVIELLKCHIKIVVAISHTVELNIIQKGMLNM